MHKFWETEDLLYYLFAFLNWRETMSVAHVNWRIRESAQEFVEAHINGLLSNFVPYSRIPTVWNELDRSGAAITGELPLVLLVHGPVPSRPIGDILEFTTPLGNIDCLYRLFLNSGYRPLHETPPEIQLEPSAGIESVSVLEKKGSRKCPRVSNNYLLFCYKF